MTDTLPTPRTNAARLACRSVDDLYGCQPLERLARELERTLTATQEALSAVRKDAERLNWIEENWFYKTYNDQIISFQFNEMWNAGRYANLRAAIDAAMGEKKRREEWNATPIC